MTRSEAPPGNGYPEIERADILHPVLDAAAMRAADAWTIQTLGVAEAALMETAGREAARMAAGMLSGPVQDTRTLRVVVCAGKGNNGGDGLVAARWLLDAGFGVHVFLTAPPTEGSEGYRANLAILTRLLDMGHAPGLVLRHAGDWSIEEWPGMPADLIIDGLFGTGLEASLRPPFDVLVRRMNEHGAPILSLDIPSGLSASTGRAFDPCIQATATVSMGALKTGHLLEDGPDVSGRIEVARIGIPSTQVRQQAASPGSGFLSTDAWVSVHLRPRSRHDHKYTTGPTIVVGGSPAFPGAPVLAARAAARVGSGYVVTAGPERIKALLQERLDAIPVSAWSEEQDAEAAVADMIEELGSRWTKARALLVGPGMGRGEDVRARLWALLDRFDGPVVLDADALFAIREDRDRIAARAEGRWILTPHEGELARLAPHMPRDISRIEHVRQVAHAWKCVVLAKGQPSISAAPDGRVMINSSGHPAAATAGSGDVLAGITAGLLAQGLDPFAAAAAGIHIGGTAASQFVEGKAAQSLTAPDIIDALPNVLRQLTDT
jgi:NAD(P)H-hydrate epimerase